MKQCFTFLFLLFTLGSLHAQLDCTNALICDDFESYVVGALGPQADHWTTWSGNEGGSEDGLVSTSLAFSGTKSLEVTGQGGPQDVLLLLGDQTTGNWRLDFKMYVYDGQRAYWNMQKCQDDPGGCWGQEVTFTEDGTGYLDAGGVDVAIFDFPHDEWFDVVQFIDLENDRSSLFIDGKPIYSWPASVSSQGTGDTLLQIGAVDFYPTNQGNHLFFIDDVRFMQIPSNSAASRMVQLTVDLANEGGADAAGVFVAGSFNGWNTTATPMENRTEDIWQVFIPVDDATDLDYKFINGTSWEIVPEECGIDDGSSNINRNIFVDTINVVADTVCFGECVSCNLINSTPNKTLRAKTTLSPNPAGDFTWLEFELTEPASLHVKLVDLTGQLVFEKQTNYSIAGKELLDLQGIASGIYFLQLHDGSHHLTRKIIIQ